MQVKEKKVSVWNERKKELEVSSDKSKMFDGSSR